MSLKVGVLMGGESEERLVSLSTGKAVIEACVALNYRVTELSFKKRYTDLLGLMEKQDIIFNALHGGIGENGKVQSWMSKNGIKYTGSGPKASALCMDKAMSKKLVQDNEINTPDWQLLYNRNDKIIIDFPFVVKPNQQGSTVGLSIVNDEKEISKAIEKGFQYGKHVIIEKYIIGKELTIPIIGDETYPIIQIKPSHGLYDYECKYTPGMSEYICPAILKKQEVEKIHHDTKLIFKEFGCFGYGRADYILDNNGVHYFLEMNTLPGMTSTSLVPKSAISKGTSFNKLIEIIIDLSL